MTLKILFASVLIFFNIGPQNKSDSLNMDLTKGFQIDNPNIFVPWNIDGKGLKEIFKAHELIRVTAKYYTTSCSSLNGLKCILGFHLETNGRLSELEFFRTDYSDQQKSFDEFQKYFVNAFGNPTKTSKGSEGLNDYEWNLGKVQIVHFVYDRFGPEEHMRIKFTK